MRLHRVTSRVCIVADVRVVKVGDSLFRMIGVVERSIYRSETRHDGFVCTEYQASRARENETPTAWPQAEATVVGDANWGRSELKSEMLENDTGNPGEQAEEWLFYKMVKMGRNEEWKLWR